MKEIRLRSASLLLLCKQRALKLSFMGGKQIYVELSTLFKIQENTGAWTTAIQIKYIFAVQWADCGDWEMYLQKYLQFYVVLETG